MCLAGQPQGVNQSGGSPLFLSTSLAVGPVGLKPIAEDLMKFGSAAPAGPGGLATSNFFGRYPPEKTCIMKQNSVTNDQQVLLCSDAKKCYRLF